MAENKVLNPPAADKKNPNRTGKVCEFLTYSGREAFKRLRTNVLISLGDKTDKRGQIIGITSAQPSEGKSTVSVNLAYTLAELGKTVLLIDCDMRRPAIHDIVSVKLTPGLADVLDGGIALNDTVSRYTSSTDKTFFDLIPGGTIPEDPVEKLNSGRFQKLLDAAANAFDYVVLDLPPVNAVVDAVNVSRYVDGMLVVLREGHCPRYVLDECMEQLRYAKANVLGFVMNGCVEGASKHYQYGSRYGYGYGYRYENKKQ